MVSNPSQARKDRLHTHFCGFSQHYYTAFSSVAIAAKSMCICLGTVDQSGWSYSIAARNLWLSKQTSFLGYALRLGVFAAINPLHHAIAITYFIATYFLFLKMQLNMRHTTAKAMPAVARMEKMTVTERCTDTISSLGTPSYGITPSGSQ